jgi:cellulose biosynthesis protein BcsQ
MAFLIGIVSQKGGVGKSTCARLIAREYANAGWVVKIADLDVSQGTSTEWKRRRDAHGIQPEVAVEPFRTVEQALRVAPHYDLLVFDAPPHSMAGTKEIARASDLILLPTGLNLDDLRPTVLAGRTNWWRPGYTLRKTGGRPVPRRGIVRTKSKRRVPISRRLVTGFSKANYPSAPPTVVRLTMAKRDLPPVPAGAG